MSELYGAKFVNQYGESDEPAFKTWCKVVGDLQPSQIQVGFIALCEDKPKYIPDALQFRDYCLGTSNLPTAHDAYIEACMAASPKDQQEYSHPAVYHAGRQAGWGYLASNIESVAFPRFRGIYEELLKRVAKGEQLEMPVIERIEHQPQPSTTDDPAYLAFKERMRKFNLQPEE